MTAASNMILTWVKLSLGHSHYFPKFECDTYCVNIIGFLHQTSQQEAKCACLIAHAPIRLLMAITLNRR